MGKFRKDELDSTVEETQPEIPTKPKIPFGHWFDAKVKAGKLKHYQDEALQVFFGKRGLKDIEDEDTYNKELEKF